MRPKSPSVDGIDDGIDFDANYTQTKRGGIALKLWGWEHEPNPDASWDGEDFLPSDKERVLVCMVGDDHYFPIDRSDITKIEEEDYCAECGQVGCCSNVKAS